MSAVDMQDSRAINCYLKATADCSNFKPNLNGSSAERENGICRALSPARALPGRDPRHMAALVAGALQFHFRGPAAAVSAGDGRGAVRGIAHYVIGTHLSLKGIRQADDDEAKVQKHRMESQDGRFLAAVLRGR
jgi:hypothetical protein